MPGFDPLPGLPASSPDFSPSDPADVPRQPTNLDQLSDQFSSLLNPAPKQQHAATQQRIEHRAPSSRDEHRTEDRREDDSKTDRSENRDTERTDGRPASQTEVRERKGDREGGGRDDSQGSADSDAPQIDTSSHSADPALPNFAFGDAILRSLGGPVEARAGTAATGVSAAGETLGKLAEQVASRILVSDPQYSGQMEVRIQLKDSVLPGTEVQITQVGDELQIRLVTESNDSFDVLSNNAELLKTQLRDRLEGRTISVEVSMQNNSEGDPDGRSRQRRDLADEWQEQQDS